MEDDKTVKNTNDLEWVKKTLVDIRSQVNEGFCGVNKRLDDANNGLRKHDAQLSTHEARIYANSDKIRWIWGAVVGIVSISFTSLIGVIILLIDKFI